MCWPRASLHECSSRCLCFSGTPPDFRAALKHTGRRMARPDVHSTRGQLGSAAHGQVSSLTLPTPAPLVLLLRPPGPLPLPGACPASPFTSTSTGKTASLEFPLSDHLRTCSENNKKMMLGQCCRAVTLPTGLSAPWPFCPLASHTLTRGLRSCLCPVSTSLYSPIC